MCRSCVHIHGLVSGQYIRRCVVSLFFKLYSCHNISISSRLLLQKKLHILPLTLVSASFVGPSGVCVVLAESAGVYV